MLDKQDVLALTGADAAEGLDPTPLGRGGGMKRFRAGTVVGAPQVTRCCHGDSYSSGRDDQ